MLPQSKLMHNAMYLRFEQQVLYSALLRSRDLLTHISNFEVAVRASCSAGIHPTLLSRIPTVLTVAMETGAKKILETTTRKTLLPQPISSAPMCSPATSRSCRQPQKIIPSMQGGGHWLRGVLWRRFGGGSRIWRT